MIETMIMKARVKETGEIVEVFREVVIGGDGYAFYTQDRDRYLFNDLDFDLMENYGGGKIIVEPREPDYWTRLEHQYAGMVMQRLIASNLDLLSHEIIEDAISYAHALVEKLKEKEERK